MDKTNCDWNTGTGIYGGYLLTDGISENLPQNIFTTPPSIKTNVYSNNINFDFICVDKLSSSKTYTGTTDVYLIDKSETYNNLPATVHVIITATGF